MAEKHIFIGLGGSGVKTVSLIKYKIYERTKPTSMKSRRRVMDETYRFIFMDTDSRDVTEANRQYRNLYEGGKEEFISPRELVDLGDMNPKIIYREAGASPSLMINRRITEACPENVAASMENRNLSFGAGALRLKSRLAFARKEQAFIQLLKNNIDQLNQNETGNEMNVIHYWVVASSNGGTGSGTFMDVLYLVNMVHRTYIDEGNPKVGLVLYMPRIYMNLNPSNKKYPLNAYAVMKEVSAFQSMAKTAPGNTLFHRMALLDDTALFDTSTPYRPFEFCIPVDFHTEDNNNLGDINKMYSNTAELMYYIHSGAGAEGFKSFLDNYEDGQTKISDDSFLIPMGYMAIRKPDEQFENYVALRARYEMLRYGIIGAPVEDPDQRKELMLSLFNTVVRPLLFERGTGGFSFYGIASAKADDIIETELPENIIRDNKNNVVRNLPQNLSIEDATATIASIRAMIGGLGKEKNQARREMESRLWRWTEENARKWGLQWVKDILQELDAYCTQLYLSYTTDSEDADILRSLRCNRRKVLVETRDGYEEELEQLYQAAVKVSIGEKVSGRNRDDVQRFFSSLKEWVQASVDVMLAEEAFDLINDLSYGDKGIIDRILAHVRQLLAEATAVLGGDKGAQQGYMSLAKSFLQAKLDVTSVYIPDVTSFVDGHGWREEGNLFSEWYGQVVGHTADFHEGEGFEPLRNGGLGSLEELFSEMVTLYPEELVQSKYLVNEESRLFTNLSRSDRRRVVEDILDFTVRTVKALIRQNTAVSQQWYEKSLAAFYADLNSEARIAVQHKTQPPLFFPFNRAQKSGHVVDCAFSVGPKGVAEEVFGLCADAPVLDSSDSSLMYRLVTKLGMSFDYYDLYDHLEREYAKNPSKEFYHFHQAFARSGGNPDQIRLPKEVSPEQVVFVKYLLLNRLCRALSGWMMSGGEAYNADTYAPSPLLRTAGTLRFATSGALAPVADDRIRLLVKDAGIDHFMSVSSTKPSYRWTEFLRGFEQRFAEGQFAALAEGLIRKLGFLAGEPLEAKYLSEFNALKREFNDLFAKATEKTEKETLQNILIILDTKLDSVGKFTGTQYFG